MWGEGSLRERQQPGQHGQGRAVRNPGAKALWPGEDPRTQLGASWWLPNSDLGEVISARPQVPLSLKFGY